jgi:quercetin dioxygenase-like cupin family protein
VSPLLTMTMARYLVTLLTATIAVLFPATAAATPAHGASAIVLSQSTVDGVDYILREITLAPGGSTGWHWHDGRLYGVIMQGTLTHDDADCSVDGIYRAGDPIIEPVGPEHVHIGRNLGDTPLVMRVLYIDPAGAPLFEDAPDPGCGFT